MMADADSQPRLFVTDEALSPWFIRLMVVGS